MTGSAFLTYEAIHHFENVQRRARWSRWWHRLLGRQGTLLSFGAIRNQLPAGARFERGVQDIPVAAIVGSIGRAEDFDLNFRPLNNFLRDRWVGVHNLRETKGWEPIVVYQVGDLYFVEDGNHRVSVAREEGMLTIAAQVYECPLPAGISAEGKMREMVA